MRSYISGIQTLGQSKRANSSACVIMCPELRFGFVEPPLCLYSFGQIGKFLKQSILRITLKVSSFNFLLSAAVS